MRSAFSSGGVRASAAMLRHPRVRPVPATTMPPWSLKGVASMIDNALHAQTDRHQLQQIITGLSEGVILIEPDQTILWANEAARKMHGVDEVAALGANVTEYRERFRLRYRNNHKLAAGSYPIDRVIAGESFADVVVEVVAVADEDIRWVHRVRSLVLTDASGEPDCLVLILTDLTEWASAEQRFERTFSANPSPAVICRLSDLRYIKVNLGFLEMTGYTREQVLDRSVYELDVLERAEKRDLAIERLGAGATIPQMEAELKLPGGGSKLVIVAGQPLEVGDEACMLFTFMDMEPRRKAEGSLRQSEERFSKAFRMMPVPTLVCTADRLCVLEVNEAFVHTSGYAAEELLDQPIEEVGLFDAQRGRATLDRVLEKSGSLSNAEYRLKTKDGELLDCLVSAEKVGIQDRPCYLMVLQDITERKRTEMELVSAIEAVMQDASWFSQTLMEKLANVRRGNSADAARSGLADLTAREREVLGLMCEGLADKEIAARLGLAPNTVRNHVATLYSKLDLHSRSEAIVWARERGFFGQSGAATARKKPRRTR
jgi:PAS domain S-box-containing protein